jgi:hypothetical protein
MVESSSNQLDLSTTVSLVFEFFKDHNLTQSLEALS